MQNEVTSSHSVKVHRVLEMGAVVLSLGYTFLYLKANVWCFLLGFLGAAIFLYLCFRKKIYADAALQIFYMAMAIYGWATMGATWEVAHKSSEYHVVLILISAILSVAFGYFLKKKTDAQRPYLDSAIAVYAVAATWLMVNFVPENWLYFIIINAASIVLYSLRGLYFGALMFVVYLLMSIDGYFELGWVASL